MTAENTTAEQLDTDTSKWQALMDGAYEQWQGKDISYDEFLAGLDETSKKAVLLGNMNYQIGNGGIRQYVDNGYACNAPEAVEVLREMGTPRAVEWAKKLEAFVDNYVNVEAKNNGFFGNRYWQHELNSSDGSYYEEEDDYDSEDEDNEAYSVAGTLDDFYYSEPFNAEFMLEVERFLSK